MQAGLSLTWSQKPKDRFSRDVAQIIILVGYGVFLYKVSWDVPWWDFCSCPAMFKRAKNIFFVYSLSPFFLLICMLALWQIPLIRKNMNHLARTIKTNSPKGKDQSSESNVPRSNVVFSAIKAIKAKHLKVNSPETLFSPL